MRWLGWLLATAFLLGWIACSIPDSAAVTAEVPCWRYTRTGWEHVSQVVPPRAREDHTLHPAVVASGFLLFSVAALLGLPAKQIRV